jgi:hypothetical protein
MLFLGHVASATVASRWASKAADLRWVIFFGLLADLVDKPIGLVIFKETINNGRVYFHSLLINLVLTLLLVAFRKPLVYPLALWVHQLTDLMWTRPSVAFWPFTGGFGYRELPFDQWVYSALNPYNVTTELIGTVVVAAIVVRYRLYKKAVFFGWLRTGRIPGDTERESESKTSVSHLIQARRSSP